MKRRQTIFTHPLTGTRPCTTPALSVLVRLGMIEAARPAWQRDAERRSRDAQDERATYDTAFAPVVQ
jgi:hypothetical protein